MILKLSASVLALLALPLFADAACNTHKQCGTCTAATGATAGQNCLWCSVQFNKGGPDPSFNPTTITNSGLGLCVDATNCYAVFVQLPMINFFPYRDSTTKHVLDINSIATDKCTSITNYNKPSPLDISKKTCATCTATADRQWCQFDQYLDKIAAPTLFRGRSGGVCLDVKGGVANFATSCSDLLKTIGANNGITIADIATDDCPKVDNPTCSSDNCQGCLTNRCTYCGTLLSASTGTSVKYTPKDLGVCRPMFDSCWSVNFGTLKTATDYKVGDTTHAMEVEPFRISLGRRLTHCKDTNIATLTHATCADCTGASLEWCNVVRTKPTHQVQGGFCSGDSLGSVCMGFTEAKSDSVYAASASGDATCPAPIPSPNLRKC